MSKTAARKKRKRGAHARSNEQRSVDRGVWGTVALVGAFILFIWWLASVETFPHALIGFVLAILGLINFYAFQACRGVRLTEWQRTFARVPLQFAGYGTRTGKPLDAAKGHDNAKMALYISIAASVLVLLVASWLILEFLG